MKDKLTEKKLEAGPKVMEISGQPLVVAALLAVEKHRKEEGKCCFAILGEQKNQNQTTHHSVSLIDGTGTLKYRLKAQIIRNANVKLEERGVQLITFAQQSGPFMIMEYSGGGGYI